MTAKFDAFASALTALCVEYDVHLSLAFNDDYAECVSVQDPDEYRPAGIGFELIGDV